MGFIACIQGSVQNPSGIFRPYQLARRYPQPQIPDIGKNRLMQQGPEHAQRMPLGITRYGADVLY